MRLQENHGLQNSPWGGGKPYLASGLTVKFYEIPSLPFDIEKSKCRSPTNGLMDWQSENSICIIILKIEQCGFTTECPNNANWLATSVDTDLIWVYTVCTNKQKKLRIVIGSLINEKTCLCHMPTTIILISLCIHAVWSAPSLFAV